MMWQCWTRWSAWPSDRCPVQDHWWYQPHCHSWWELANIYKARSHRRFWYDSIYLLDVEVPVELIQCRYSKGMMDRLVGKKDITGIVGAMKVQQTSSVSFSTSAISPVSACAFICRRHRQHAERERLGIPHWWKWISDPGTYHIHSRILGLLSNPSGIVLMKASMHNLAL